MFYAIPLLRVLTISFFNAKIYNVLLIFYIFLSFFMLNFVNSFS